MNNNLKYYTFAFLALLFFSACDKKEYQTIVELDDSNIQEYIQKNGISVEEYENTGIYYSIVEEGTGPVINYEDKIPLVFTLKTLDGTYNSVDTFSAANRYYDFLGYFPYGSASANAPGSPLDQETGMKVILKNVLKNANGKVRVIVPSRLAYGRNGTKLIPSNASIDYLIHAIDPENIPAYEDESIRKYIASLGFQSSDFEKTSTGIYYKIDALGTGEFLNESTNFKAAYDLKFLDGASFQKADSATFNLKEVIPAWREVMPKVKESGKIRMLIPSAQAYGFEGRKDQNTGAVAIPPFASLDYEVQVVKVLN